MFLQKKIIIMLAMIEYSILAVFECIIYYFNNPVLESQN